MLNKNGALAALGLLLGCPSPKDDSGSPDTDTASTVCYERESDNGAPDTLTCDLPTPCDTVPIGFYEDKAKDTEVDKFDAKIGQCVIDALAAGDAAQLTAYKSERGGKYTESWSMQLLGDGTVIWSHYGFNDATGFGEASWRALPAASTFEDCTLDGSNAFVSCISKIDSQECLTGEPTCP